MTKFFASARTAAALSACALLLATAAPTPSQAATGCGHASWYALHSRTASGEMMNPSRLTAAHKSMRFGTKLKVTNMRNGRSVVVRVNDRGPFIKGRVLDLSKGAASQIGMVGSGVGKVCYTIIK